MRCVEELVKDNIEIKKNIVEMCHRLGNNGAHLGGCLSLAEIMTVLYCKVLAVDDENLMSENRDRVIMSKGHGSIAMYAGMIQRGLINSLEDIGGLLGELNIYYKQEVRNVNHGLEFSSGSLGQGLAFAIGIAWSLKKKGNRVSKIYVVVGDGECNEGSVWEAASIAGHLKLDNIIVIVDKNGLQIDGRTADINCQNNMEERWRCFGFETVEIDGNNLKDVEIGLKHEHEGKPLAVIANTIKGNGVSYAANNVEWHQNVMTDELYKQALSDIGGMM